MAKKTIEERINDLREKTIADLSFYTNPETSGLAVKAGVAKGKVGLQVKVALAAETAKADHAILLASAALIQNMGAAERETLRQARAVAQGLATPEEQVKAATPTGTERLVDSNGQLTPDGVSALEATVQ